MATPGKVWSPADLDQIDRSEEIQVAPRRTDGSLQSYVTIWVVEVGDDLFVRSARGVESNWWRRATASGSGRIRAGDIERDVVFEAATDLNVEVDRAYHRKYDRYGERIVGTVVGASAQPTTLRVLAT
jgi:hypothetical protein